ncbi:MAG: antitoxin StbD [Enterobacterales bacterium]|jgi:antitoxin StbD
MAYTILADTTASITDLKKNPMSVVNQGEGFPVAILNRNKPAFYCIPAEAYEDLLNKLEDMELNAIADARADQKRVKVDMHDL